MSSRYSPQGQARAMAASAAQHAYGVAHRLAQRDRDAIDRVRSLHAPASQDDLTICTHCSGLAGTPIEHPCPTTQALDTNPTETT